MVNFFDFLLHCRYILRLHVLYNNERKRTLAEIIQQFVLSDDRIHVFRQIIKHIVVYTRRGHSEERRHT